MAWRIEMGGPLRILKDGEVQRFRTRHQMLLLARLAAYSPEPISRAGTAQLLWPESPRDQALTYLRRAVMELRQAGLDLQTDRQHIALPDGVMECDLQEGMPASIVMEGIDHPIADEIRSIYWEGFDEGGGDSDPGVLPAGEDSLFLWLGNTLIAEQPEAAMHLFSRHARDLLLTHSPALVLSSFLRVLSASKIVSPERVDVLQYAGLAANLLTRYRLAERLDREAVRTAEEIGEHLPRARILARTAFFKMEQRQWEQARHFLDKAVAALAEDASPNPSTDIYSNVAGIQWHMLLLDDSVKNYRHAVLTSPLGFPRDLALANSTYLWVALGADVPADTLLLDYLPYDQGFAELTQAYGNFALALGRGEIKEANAAVIRLLDASIRLNMDRMFCVAIDCVALLLARRLLLTEAAAVMRVGTRIRLIVGHQRSPGERQVIRRNVPRPYRGSSIEALERRLFSDDFAAVGQSLQGVVRGRGQSC